MWFGCRELVVEVEAVVLGVELNLDLELVALRCRVGRQRGSVEVVASSRVMSRALMVLIYNLV